MISIKRSTGEDVPFIYSELKKFSAFYGTRIPLFPKDEMAAVDTITQIVLKHVCFTSFYGEERTGFIAGWFTRHPFNSDILLLSEAFWWVAEKHRQTRAGQALLDHYIAWGKENADWMTMTLEVESPVNANVLIKRGFKLKESNFLMECT